MGKSKTTDFSGREASKMLSTTSLRMGLRLALTRNMATTTVLPAQAATDPIQQMFADKVKEYANKKAAAGGKLPDASKEPRLPSLWSSRRLPRLTEAEQEWTCQSSQTSNSSTLWWTTFPSSKPVIKCRYIDRKLKNHHIHN